MATSSSDIDVPLLTFASNPIQSRYEGYRALDDDRNDERKEDAEGPDISEDMERLKKAALEGRADAQAKLGSNYYYGAQTTKNHEEGAKWLQTAAKRQDTFAGQWAQGICLEEGIGMSKNNAAALTCYQRAAEQNYAPAQRSLGNCYKNGFGRLTKNEKLAFEYYQKAALTYSTALVDVAWCYSSGVGVSKDEKKAFKLYEAAAYQGNAHSQATLSWCYYYCNLGITLKDEGLAVKYASLAAEQGSAWGQSLLADYYWNRKEKSLAVKFWRQAAEQGHSYSQHQMGLCHSHWEYLNHGTTSDWSESQRWFRLAADQGYEPAQSNVCCYKCIIL